MFESCLTRVEIPLDTGFLWGLLPTRIACMLEMGVVNSIFIERGSCRGGVSMFAFFLYR